MTASNLQVLRDDFRMMDAGDSWGNVMGWWFTIADDLWFRGECVPEHWQYKPSPLGPTNEADSLETTICAETDSDTLRRFGNTLYRYAAMLRQAGEDY